jgi:hypothetical protein
MNLAQHKSSRAPEPIRRAVDLRHGHALFFEVGKDVVEDCGLAVVEDVTTVGEAVYVELRGRDMPLVRLGVDEEVTAFRLIPFGSDEI